MLMVRVYIADAMPSERLALRLVLWDLNLDIAGEAENWSTALAEIPIRSSDMLVVDWKLLPDAPNATLAELRRACPKALVIIIISISQTRRGRT